MDEIISRHEKIALMFSGGKDSLACLYMMRPYMDKITVIWVNTGDAFPETERIVRDFAATVPNFLEVRTDVMKFKNEYGHPTDLLPTKHSYLNITAQGLDIPMFVNNLDCCAQNIWFPAMDAVRSIGATLIIRGQRNEEEEKSVVRSGMTVDGFEFLFPIEEWSTKDVLSYLMSQGYDYPPHFKFSESSLDCQHCTSCIHAYSDRTQFMKEKYPAVYSENQRVLSQILTAIEEETNNIKDYLNGK